MTVILCHNGMTARRLVAVLLTGVVVLAIGSARSAAAADAPLTVGEVRIVTDDIFETREVEEASGALLLLRRAMNGVHLNTRHYVIRRELLFHTGDPFDPALLEETERNLRDLGFLNNIRVTAVEVLP